MGISRISPELHPKSSEKFMKKDYPADNRPEAKGMKGMARPYPTLQNKNGFAADFVEDENSDHGEWKFQIEYDTLRHKLQKDKESTEKAYAKKQEELKELEEAEKDEKRAEEKTAEARHRADDARKES